MRSILLLALVAAPFGMPLAARAEPVPTCHCFRNRTFDPESPAAADPYILATARSSLLSAALGPPKAALVQSAMSGAHPDALWIAHWAAKRDGRDPGALLAERIARGSWRDALDGNSKVAPVLSAALARGATDAELAALVVDDVLATGLSADRAAVRALRAAGANSEETIAATLLATRLRTPATAIFARVHAGKASWGMVFHEAGLAPQQIDAAVRTAIR